jgi:hypothetical protein
MLAVDLAGDLRLVNLERQLDALLADVLAGRCFMPFYSQWIERALAAIRQEPF